jgi:hypothetical protein
MRRRKLRMIRHRISTTHFELNPQPMQPIIRRQQNIRLGRIPQQPFKPLIQNASLHLTRPAARHSCDELVLEIASELAHVSIRVTARKDPEKLRFNLRPWPIEVNTADSHRVPKKLESIVARM